MKKGYIRLLIPSLIFFAVITFNLFRSTFTENTLIIFLALFLVGTYIFVRYEKDNMRYKKDILLLIVIYSLSYYVLTYLLGVFTGFYRTPYNLAPLVILRNILPIIITIILAELIRYMIVIKGSKYKTIIILTTIMFVLLDLTLIIHVFNLSEPDRLLEFLITLVIPSISKNILLTYLACKVGYKGAILYRLLFESTIVFLPIFPDYGLYIASLLYLIRPAVLTFFIYVLLEKQKRKEVYGKVKKKKIYYGLIPLAIFIIIGVALITGWFKYFAIVVGSQSMYPNIKKGDVIIVERLNKAEQSTLVEGETIIFEHDNVVIIHRLVRILEVNGELYFYTKGDNNEAEDGWALTHSDIIGRARFRIPVIGFPTVWLNEQMN